DVGRDQPRGADRGSRGPGPLEPGSAVGDRGGGAAAEPQWCASRPPASRQLAAAPAAKRPRRCARRIGPRRAPGLDWRRADPGAEPGDRRACAESVDRARPARVLARRHPPEPVAARIPAGPAGKRSPAVKTRIVTEPRFAAETTALLARLG